MARISQEKHCIPIYYLLSHCASGHFLPVCTFVINFVIYFLPIAVVELKILNGFNLHVQAVKGDPFFRREIGLMLIKIHLGCFMEIKISWL